MSKVVILFGFAQSGKTTVAGPILKKLGYEKVSTSDALHQVTRKFIHHVTGAPENRIDTYNKSIVDWKFRFIMSRFTSYTQSYTQIRTLLIDIAEKVLVPVFGRRIFSDYAAQRVIAHYINNQNCYFECIGGEEYHVFSQILPKHILHDAIKINLRRDSEDQEADYRTLCEGGVHVYNNGTPDDLEESFRKLLC